MLKVDDVRRFCENVGTNGARNLAIFYEALVISGLARSGTVVSPSEDYIEIYWVDGDRSVTIHFTEENAEIFVVARLPSGRVIYDIDPVDYDKVLGALKAIMEEAVDKGIALYEKVYGVRPFRLTMIGRRIRISHDGFPEQEVLYDPDNDFYEVEGKNGSLDNVLWVTGYD